MKNHAVKWKEALSFFIEVPAKEIKLLLVRIFTSNVRVSKTRRGFRSVTVGGTVPVTTVASTLH